MTYEEQLLTPQWAAKRLEIIRRDWEMCTHCMSTKNLQVHHKRYIPGRMAWEYHGWDSFDLITLCEKCHAEEHGIDWIKKANPMPHDFGRGKTYSIDGRPVRHISQVIREFFNG